MVRVFSIVLVLFVSWCWLWMIVSGVVLGFDGYRDYIFKVCELMNLVEIVIESVLCGIWFEIFFGKYLKVLFLVICISIISL